MKLSFSILKIKTILIIGFLYLTSLTFAQPAVFTSPGTTTWTVPPCVTSITVQVWGAGGGGGGTIAISRNGDEACSAAAGGGGGGFSSSTYTVIPGQTYTIVVGGGGTGGTGGAGTWNGGISTQPSAGGIGGSSSFTGNGANLQATGGSGGFGAGSYNTGSSGTDVNVNGTTAGVGGSGSGGTVNFLGGNGAVGNINVAANGGIDKSGGGGGAAGPGGNGGNASHNGATANPPGGIGQAAGGNGGSGRYYNSPNSGGFNGNPGLVYGGGGGGALTHRGAYNVGSHVGGAGASGAVIINYSATGAPNQPSVISGLTPIPCGGYTGTYAVTNDPSVTSYTWTYSGTGTITGSGNSITLNATTGGTLTVIPTGSCDGPARTLVITLQPAPNPPTSITGVSAICPGNSTTLTAVGGNVGGVGVTTQWFTGSCGGTSVGTGTTLTVSPVATTTYFVQTSNACGQSTCVQRIVTVNPVLGGTASISQTTFCGSTSANLSLTGQTGTGTIQWQQSTNGGATWTNIPGATTTPYTVNGISVTTSYRAVVSSSGCTSGNSTVVTITSTPNLTPNVAITGAPASSICAGSSVTFNANPTNGGITPTYQWQINGVNVVGATNATFTSTTLANNDIVTVVMTSNDPCAATPTATSAGSTITVGGTITPSVTITGAPASSICAGSSVTFTANPTNGGTTPTYQWQINGVNVVGATNATFTSTTLANNDIVTVVMTSNDPCAATPTATSAGSTITVGGTITPSVAITGAPASSICAGSSVTFTANPTNGGTTPTYQWQINGVNVVGATNATFTSTTLANNDIVTVVMTSNDPCAATPTATSAGSTITVGGTITPSVAITGAPVSSICAGSSVTFTANPTNGGTTPSYQWQINGVDVVGETASTFTSTTLANNDIVTVVMTSNDPCAATPTATSAGSTIAVGGTITPSVAITGAPVSSICAGSSVTFTANPTNGGTTPTYQWQINGVNVNGATNVTFTSTTLANNDIVTVVMTSNDPCAATPTATSAGSTITVGGTITPSVAITGAPASSICAGSSVTFTANPTNGGTTPTYQWQINGINVNGATNVTFTSTTLANNDIVTVIMTSNDPCAATPTATSAGSTITVGGTITPSVTITGAPASSICAGSSVTFTANPTNGGTTPTYQWQINGVNVVGATNATFTSTTLANNDIVTVVMASNDPCAATPTATSAGSTITVGGTITPSVAITGAPASSICAGSSVTFTANPTNGGTTPTYQWQINGVNVPGATSTTFTSTSLANNNVVTVIMTSNDPCVTTPTATSAGSTITVGGTITPSVTISGAPITAICAGSSVTFTANPTNGGTNPTYQWQINGVNVPGATGTTFTSTNLGNNNVVTVLMTSNDPCASTPTATSAGSTITISSTINATITSTSVACGAANTGSATVVASGGTAPYTYNWSPTGGTAATATGLSVGTYTVTITDFAGCSTTVSTTVTGSAGLSLVTSATRVNCGSKNGTATATATGGTGNITYVWNPGNLTGQTISNLSVGNYTVTATDGSGCSATANVFVGQNGNLNLQANPYTAVVEEGNSVNLNASFSPYIPGTTYSWTPPNGLSCTDCPNPTATPTQTTTYNVQIITPDGCTADTNIKIIYRVKCGEFFVPTIFSPNGDGNNDEFKVYGKCVVAINMKIYDRWGELVFESDDQSFGWDGTYKGQLMNSASFVYVIDVSFLDERFEHVKGNVSLVR